MKKSFHKPLVLLIFAPIFIYTILEAYNFGFYLTHKRDPLTYVLPPDFLGWVVILNEGACSPNDIISKNIYKISDEGWGCVSKAFEPGFATDKVYHQNRESQNLVAHPKSRMNFVWYDHKFKHQGRSYYAFYVGYEPFKHQKESLFKALQEKIKLIPL